MNLELQAIYRILDPAPETSGLRSCLEDLLPRLTPILKNRHEKVQDTGSGVISGWGLGFRVCDLSLELPVYISQYMGSRRSE